MMQLTQKGLVIIISLLCSTPLYSQTDSLTSKEKDKIRAVVQEWILNKTLETPESYKEGKFYDYKHVIDLDKPAKKAYTDWVDTEYKALEEMFGDTSNHSINFRESLKDSCSYLYMNYNSFKKVHIGFAVKHTFRAKNKEEDNLYYETEFILNNAFEIQETSVKERKRTNEKTG